MKPLMRNFVIKGVYPAPLRQCISRAIDRYNDILSRVVGLLGICCPSTVSRFVISIVVDSVYGESLRGLSHILKEKIKLPPSVAHFYSSCSVIFKSVTVRVVASFYHRRPSLINGRVRSSVLWVTISSATTRFHSSSGVFEIISSNHRSVSTIANAHPRSNPFSGDSYDNQLVKPLSYFIHLRPIDPTNFYSYFFRRFFHGDFMLGFSWRGPSRGRCQRIKDTVFCKFVNKLERAALES